MRKLTPTTLKPPAPSRARANARRAMTMRLKAELRALAADIEDGADEKAVARAAAAIAERFGREAA